MARSRVPAQVAAKRDLITSAAATVMARDGIAATSLRQVAGEADVSTGSVLYYFGEFDDVVRAAIARMAAEYDTSRRAAAESARDARQALRRLVALGLPDRLDGALAVLFQAHFVDDPDGSITRLLADLNARQRQLYVDAIERGEHEGLLTPDAPVADIARTALSIEDAHSLYELRGYGPGMPAARRVLRRYLAGALAMRI